MSKKTIAALMLAAVAPLLTSCLSDNDDDVVYYDEAGITSFALTSVNQYTTTVDDEGESTTKKTVVDGSAYKFYIDQLTGEIYNPDSLPYGCDAAHVLTTVTSKYSGTIVLKATDSDDLSYYSSSDSIDFSTPRAIRAYSNSGLYYREYTVRVNVHQEEPDVMKWSQLATSSSLAALKGMRSVVAGGRLWVMGTDGTASHLYHTALTDGATWDEAALPTETDDEAWQSLTTWQGQPCWLSAGQCVCATLAPNGQPTGFASYGQTSWPELRRLAGTDGSHLYAIGTDGQLWASPTDLSADDAWQQQPLDEASTLLPVGDLHLLSLPVRSNAGASRLVLVGNRESDTDSHAMVWGRIVETDDDALQQPWSYCDVTADIRYPAPYRENLQVVGYDSGMLALGGEGLGATAGTVTALDQFYLSVDGGITWQPSTTITLPDALTADSHSFALASDDTNHLWIVGGESGQVWRGRLNRLGWTQTETAFVK